MLNKKITHFRDPRSEIIEGTFNAFSNAIAQLHTIIIISSHQVHNVDYFSTTFANLHKVDT